MKNLLKLKQDARNGSDDFQTPNVAMDYLLPYIPKRFTKIWEPAFGKGNIVLYLQKHQFKVVATDMAFNQDFFELCDSKRYEGFSFDAQITNPPYSLKDRWLEYSFKINKPFALLLPVSAIHSIKRCNLFRKYGIQLVIPPKRIDFITPSNGKSSAWFASAWFCWGFDLENDLNFPQ